jgi:hypothetical protein
MLDKFKQSMFKPINTSAISIMAVFTILWGIWVGNPFWTVFDQAPIFSFMTAIFPEWAWGAVAIVVGLTMMYGVIKPSYMTLKNGALTGFYFWLFGSINFFLGDWQNTGGLTLFMIAVYCGYVALNIWVNKKEFIVEQENLAFRKDE